MPEHAQEAQDKSIKDRKRQLYEAEPSVADKGSGKSFNEFLRQTPAAPLSGLTKAALWAMGIIVVLLLGAALLKGPTRPKSLGRTTMITTVAVIHKA